MAAHGIKTGARLIRLDSDGITQVYRRAASVPASCAHYWFTMMESQIKKWDAEASMRNALDKATSQFKK
jgi:hypothetical protein